MFPRSQTINVLETYTFKEKKRKNIKSILICVEALFVILVGCFSCERIDAGHEGIKVNLYGSGKGVDNVSLVTGMVFYNPFKYSNKCG